jgi:hypothetical protein
MARRAVTPIFSLYRENREDSLQPSASALARGDRARHARPGW